MDNRNDGALERNYFHPKKIKFDSVVLEKRRMK